VTTSGGSQLFDALRAIPEVIGDTQACGDVDRLRDLVRVSHPPQRIPRRLLARHHVDLLLVNRSRRAYPEAGTASIVRPAS
jgi:hypothetical protein